MSKRVEKIIEYSDGGVRYYEKEKPADKSGIVRGATNVTEYHPKRGVVHTGFESRDHSGKVVRVHLKHINGKSVILPHYPPTGEEQNEATLKRQQKASYPHATKQFEQSVQVVRLTSSYNINHKKAHIPEKGVTSGSIGWVAYEIEYIQGLVLHKSRYLRRAIFSCWLCLIAKCFLVLMQIFCDLAIGMYTYNTVLCRLTLNGIAAI